MLPNHRAPVSPVANGNQTRAKETESMKRDVEGWWGRLCQIAREGRIGTMADDGQEKRSNEGNEGASSVFKENHPGTQQ